MASVILLALHARQQLQWQHEKAHRGPCSTSHLHTVVRCARIVLVVAGGLSHVGVLVLIPESGHVAGCG